MSDDHTISGGTGFVPGTGNGGSSDLTDAGGIAAPPEAHDGPTVQGPYDPRYDPYAAPYDAQTQSPAPAAPRRYVPAPPTADRPNDRPVKDISHPVIAPPVDEEKEEEKRKENRPFYKKPKYIVGAIALLLLVLALAFGIPWYLNYRQYRGTDDAIIDAHSSRVAPQVSGRVLAVPVDDNQMVKAGDLLVRIDPSEYQARVDQAAAALAQARGMLQQARAQKVVNEANVAQAQADVEVAKANAANAGGDLQRYSGLSKEAVSRQTLQNAQQASRSAEANVTAAEKKVAAAQAQVDFADSQIVADQANIKSAQAQLEQADLQLSYTKLQARTDGRVTRKNVSVGDYVSAAQQVMVVVPQEVFVTANYKETELTDMRVGQSATITVDAYPDVKFTGKIASIQSGTGAHFSLLPPENATGNYVKVVQRVPVKIVFDDTTSEAYRRLSPGMSVEPSVKID